MQNSIDQGIERFFLVFMDNQTGRFIDQQQIFVLVQNIYLSRSMQKCSLSRRGREKFIVDVELQQIPFLQTSRNFTALFVAFDPF